MNAYMRRQEARKAKLQDAAQSRRDKHQDYVDAILGEFQEARRSVRGLHVAVEYRHGWVIVNGDPKNRCRLQDIELATAALWAVEHELDIDPGQD